MIDPVRDCNTQGQTVMYLEYFGLKQYPFALTPNTKFYCNLPGYQTALNVLLFSLKSGEGFIKIIGEVGSGKTLLCRKLMNMLDDSFHTAYIPNPDLDPNGLRIALAKELWISVPNTIEQGELLDLILKRLLSLRAEGKKVVLLIDEAQALSDESLEALRLLTNLETESEKLLQIILFAQSELDLRLKRHAFRQLNQRFTFSHVLVPLNRRDLEAYLCHRLSIAGYTQGSIFDDNARDLLYRASDGIPRVINILCHKAMMASYGFGEHFISLRAMRRAINDSQNIVASSYPVLKYILSFACGIAALGVLSWVYFYLFI